MLRLERDTFIDVEHTLAQGLRLVALQRRAYSVDGAFPYSGYTVSSRGVQKGLTSAAGVDSAATGHTFLVVANLTAVSSDAVAFGRLRYNASANYGAGLRFNAATLELDGGIGTSAWHYSASSSAVQTGRHVYAGAIGVGDSTSTGRLWRDGSLLTTGVYSATAYAASRWDGQVDLGGGTASGASAITGSISGHIESGLYYARSLPTEDVEYLSAAMLRGRLPFMRRRRIWVLGSVGGGATGLTIADATHAHTADNVVLTTATTLVIADATHAHMADSPTLSAETVLAITNALHNHTADSLGLSVEQYLAIQNTQHAHSADNVVLNTESVLAIQAALHAHSVDSLTLTITGSENLVIADASHYHTVDNLLLETTGQVNLVIANSTHGHYVDSIDLSTDVLLAINDALHSHTADVVTLSIDISLLIDNTLHAHTADSPHISDAPTLNIHDTLHGHNADSLILTGEAWLIIQSASHDHTAANITLSLGGLGVSELVTATIIIDRNFVTSIVNSQIIGQLFDRG